MTSLGIGLSSTTPIWALRIEQGLARRGRTSYSGRTLARDNRGVRPCDQGATSGVCGGGSVLRRAVAVSSADGVWGSASFALIRLWRGGKPRLNMRRGKVRQRRW
ncbi:hypothetical protein BC936DRAFT_137902 [Jimgerdemannia flammicorona]|uniref:Uncharacterized protein n=1 Tax=Jimgerdemannia flammicorona TaxID=994334 RepID=A0A433DIR5_9FUNG|nr:hypothetical protein BC936DRAFT_137902 [Jimgerdemannia flammicorona]